MMQVNVWLPSRRFPTDPASVRLLCSLKLLMRNRLWLLSEGLPPCSTGMLGFLSSKKFLVWKPYALVRVFPYAVHTYNSSSPVSPLWGARSCGPALALLFYPKYLRSLLATAIQSWVRKTFSLTKPHAVHQIILFGFIFESSKVELDCFLLRNRSCSKLQCWKAVSFIWTHFHRVHTDLP